MRSKKICIFLVVVLLTTLLLIPFEMEGALGAPPCPAHAPININGNAEFTAANGVTGGSGTQADPYIISGWCISAFGTTGIFIRNTNAHFDIRNVHVHSGGLGHSNSNGILIWNVHHGRVTNSSFTKNSYGIFVRDSYDIAVVDNELTENEGDGIFIRTSSAVEIQDNIVWKNDGRGIGLFETQDVLIKGNGISWNGHQGGQDGVYVASSTRVTINENNILYNGGPPPPPPIEIQALPSETGGHSVYLVSSYQVKVYHNNIIGNHLHANQLFGGGNVWDDGYPSGGNFWSGYDGVDSDSDGIGDTPQVLMYGNGVDRYPLMDPLSGTIFISGHHFLIKGVVSQFNAVLKTLDGLDSRLANKLARFTRPDEDNREVLWSLFNATSAIINRVEGLRASIPPLPREHGRANPEKGSGPFHAMAAEVAALDGHLARILLNLPDPSRLSMEVLEELDSIARAAASITARIRPLL